MDDDGEFTPVPVRRPTSKAAAHSKFVGVTWHRQDQKWQAAIKVEGKSLHLGHFLDEFEAARKYDEYAARLGRNVNFPENVYEGAGTGLCNARATKVVRPHRSKKKRGSGGGGGGDGGEARQGDTPPPRAASARAAATAARAVARRAAASTSESEDVDEEDDEDDKGNGNEHHDGEKSSHLAQPQAPSPSSSAALGGGEHGGSKFVGVTWNRRAQKWEVRIYTSGRNMYLGSFNDEVEAACK